MDYSMGNAGPGQAADLIRQRVEERELAELKNAASSTKETGHSTDCHQSYEVNDNAHSFGSFTVARPDDGPVAAASSEQQMTAGEEY